MSAWVQGTFIEITGPIQSRWRMLEGGAGDMVHISEDFYDSVFPVNMSLCQSFYTVYGPNQATGRG